MDQTGKGLGTVRKGAEMVYSEVAIEAGREGVRNWQGRV
jgi:hypothetical protein